MSQDSHSFQSERSSSHSSLIVRGSGRIEQHYVYSVWQLFSVFVGNLPLEDVKLGNLWTYPGKFLGEAKMIARFNRNWTQLATI